MKSHGWIRIVFALSALYDGLLGLLFILRPDWPFERFNVPPPNHFGYVEFPAAVVLIFAFMFARIAINPSRHRELIVYGILLKLAYVWVSGWHWLHGNIPTMWKPFIVIDAICAVLFLVAYASLFGKSPGGGKHR
jgi:hypothetical protein